jgi:hypothetical protein
MRDASAADVSVEQGGSVACEPPTGGTVAPLFSVKAIVWATILGSFLAGSILIAINYGRLGRRKAQVLTLVLAPPALVAFLVLVTYGFPSYLLGAAQAPLMYVITRHLQGLDIDASRYSGAVVSVVWAIGISLACAVLIFGVAFLVALSGQRDIGERLTFNEADEVFYTDQATEADARDLGEILTSCGYFGWEGATAVVSRSGAEYTICFVVEIGAWEEADVIAAYSNLGASLADDFGRPLHLELWDAEMRCQESLLID